MRSIAMLDPIDVGQVQWNGRAVMPSEVPEFRRSVCYVPQRMPSFEGTVRGRAVKAHGFVELVGYAGAFRARI